LDYVPGDGDAEGQRVFTAPKRFCAAVVTPPRAATTPDTALALGFAARLLTAVLRLASAAFRELVCACHWPCASFTKGRQACLNVLEIRLDLSTVPAPTLTWVSLSSEARSAAASAHRTESGAGAAWEAVVDGEGVLEGVPPDAPPPPDPHPATSSARALAIIVSFHLAGLVTIPGFIPLTISPGARRLRLVGIESPRSAVVRFRPRVTCMC
jgi:hypothetical protein